LVCLLLLGTSGVAAAGGKRSEDAKIRAMLAEWKQAFEARDVAGVMKMYAPGAELVAFDVVPPLQYTGHDAYNIASGKAVFDAK
jgi:ketosteroid isomerase-like protein